MTRARTLMAAAGGALALAALEIALCMGACANFANQVQQFSANYQTSIAAINADIAATAPTVAIACSDLQTAGVLVAPFVPTSKTAQGAFAATNAAISTYCQEIPTDIPTTLAQVQAAALSAKKAYAAVKAGAA